VAVVAEHNCEEERKGNDSEYSWVGFTVVGYAICVSNHLRNFNNGIAFEKGGWRVRHRSVFIFLPLIETNLRKFLKSLFY